LRHHPQAFTPAEDVAASEHVPGDEVTKPVIAFADGRMVMLQVAASQMVQMAALWIRATARIRVPPV
jgi:hypothetical protein